MCYFQGKPVGEYCTQCHSCTDFLAVCIPVVSFKGYVSAECDFDFCMEYCPCYSECDEAWGKAVSK